MFKTCLVVVLSLALVAAPAPAHEKARNVEVRAAFTAFARDWGGNNPQALSAYFEDHADLIDPSGRRATGRMEIEKLFQEQHSTIFKGSRMVFTVETVRFLEPDQVLADAEATVDGMKTPEGTVLPPQRFHVVTVMHRKHDIWRVVAWRPYVFQSPR